MTLIRLKPGDLLVGVALPWRVFDATGRLVLRAGHTLNSPAQIDTLLDREIYREPTDLELNPGSPRKAGAGLDPFTTLTDSTARLAAGLQALTTGGLSDARSWVAPLVDNVIALGHMHADAVLGGLLVMDDLQYSQAHPWMCATLCDLIARRVTMEEADRRSLIAAALVSNVGMFEVQDLLANQSAPLTDEQRRIVQRHPIVSTKLLAAAGLEDPRCLQYTLQHHERLDGSGYPRKLLDPDIVLGSRVLALSDIYSAMVLPRGYRDGLHAKKALREIFTQRGSQIDGELAATFIKELGVFPPGIFVRLENGETGVVVRRNPLHANKPMVSTVRNLMGKPLERPIIRDTAEAKAYTIVEVLPREPLVLPLAQVWGI